MLTPLTERESKLVALLDRAFLLLPIHLNSRHLEWSLDYYHTVQEVTGREPGGSITADGDGHAARQGHELEAAGMV